MSTNKSSYQLLDLDLVLHFSNLSSNALGEVKNFLSSEEVQKAAFYTAMGISFTILYYNRGRMEENIKNSAKFLSKGAASLWNKLFGKEETKVDEPEAGFEPFDSDEPTQNLYPDNPDYDHGHNGVYNAATNHPAVAPEIAPSAPDISSFGTSNDSDLSSYNNIYDSLNGYSGFQNWMPSAPDMPSVPEIVTKIPNKVYSQEELVRIAGGQKSYNELCKLFSEGEFGEGLQSFESFLIIQGSAEINSNDSMYDFM